MHWKAWLKPGEVQGPWNTDFLKKGANDPQAPARQVSALLQVAKYLAVSMIVTLYLKELTGALNTSSGRKERLLGEWRDDASAQRVY